LRELALLVLNRNRTLATTFGVCAHSEQLARKNIDQLLDACGWQVQHYRELNLSAGRGVAVREFPLRTGFADYALFVDRRIIGAIEAKAEGTPLTGIEAQTAKYSVGLPAVPPAWHSPLPFLYESTGVETFFTNGLDPDPRSRRVFAFHRPETLASWAGRDAVTASLRARLRHMPPLVTTGLWEEQIEAITNLERSPADNRPRTHPDGDWQRQDFYRRQLYLSPGQVRRRAPRAVPGGSQQPGTADAQSVPAIRHA
jgi:type I site-specific restriction endonuclease